MNDAHDKNGLDQALRHWAAVRTPDDSDREPLRQQIAAAMEHDRVSPAEQESALFDTTDRQRRAIWFGSGVAATLLIALAAWPWLPGDLRLSSGSPHDPPRENIPPEFAWLMEPQLADKQALFGEAERVFDGKVAWIAETGGEVRIGLAPDDGFASSDSRRLAIRLVVTRTTRHEAQPTPVWAVDLVSVNEQLIRLDDAGDDTRLQVWAYCLPDDDRVAIDTSLELEGIAQRQTSYSRVQDLGTPQLVDTWIADEAEYRVYQTVTQLNSEVL